MDMTFGYMTSRTSPDNSATSASADRSCSLKAAPRSCPCGWEIIFRDKIFRRVAAFIFPRFSSRFVLSRQLCGPHSRSRSLQTWSVVLYRSNFVLRTRGDCTSAAGASWRSSQQPFYDFLSAWRSAWTPLPAARFQKRINDGTFFSTVLALNHRK